MEDVIKFFIGASLMLGLMFVFALLVAYPIMWTWNYTFPALFGLPEVTVWQALWGGVCMRLAFGTGTQSAKSK